MGARNNYEGKPDHLYLYNLKEIAQLKDGNFDGIVGSKIASEIVNGAMLGNTNPRHLVEILRSISEKFDITVCPLMKIAVNETEFKCLILVLFSRYDKNTNEELDTTKLYTTINYPMCINNIHSYLDDGNGLNITVINRDFVND